MCEYTHIDTDTNTRSKVVSVLRKTPNKKMNTVSALWGLICLIACVKNFVIFLRVCLWKKNSSSFQEFFIISHSRSLFSFQSYEFSLFVVDLPRAEDPALSTDKAGRIVSELHYKNFLLGAWNAFDTCNSISLYTWKSGINGFTI